jgi:hypothetical protein
VKVVRSDATQEFVDVRQEAGQVTRTLDVRTDDLGSPFAGVIANAVLLHLNRQEFRAVLRRCRAAVVEGGFLAFTVKEGEGARWSDDKIGLPRYFGYWREQPLRGALPDTRWNVLLLDHVVGRTAERLHVIAAREPDSVCSHDGSRAAYA